MNPIKHKRYTFLLNALVLFMIFMGGSLAAQQKTKPASTADHKQFVELQKQFTSGPEVTKACLSCHTEASKHIMKTTHWTWEFVNPKNQLLGKKNVVNNFCIATATNEPRCTSCHIGYGWKDKDFDFKKEDNVDCIVCHDTTGTYKKFPAGAGHPVYKETEFPPNSGKIWKPADLKEIAQNVGKTSRKTCGSCHFSGGGGEAVKHGDLDSSLINGNKQLDVHMDPKGLNFTCSTCHQPTNHNIPGSRYVMKGKDTKGVDVPGKDDQNRASCESCHGLMPHKFDIQINGHVHKVACESCHIPTVAKLEATKVWWDWSKAGQKNPEGKNIIKKDAEGNVIYDTQKGEFRWQKNFVPDYVWFNGDIHFNELKTKIDDSKTLQINAFHGGYKDPNSRIWPVKRFEATQPYDTVNKTLVIPHLFGKDDNAYWKTYDWQKAIVAGMTAVNAPYSGQYGFVKSEMLWPQTHMVAPKEDAVKCESCHAKEGRLKHLGGFYLPGRDRNTGIELIGYLSILGSILAGIFFVVKKKPAPETGARKMVRVYKPFEIFWHAVLGLTVLGLAFTGFEIHGSYNIIGYRAATLTHDVLTIVIAALAVVGIFYEVVTGGWKHHALSKEKLAWLFGGASKGLPYPSHSNEVSDITNAERYINWSFKIVIWGLMGITGTMYIGFVIFHDFFAMNISRELIAVLHTFGAYTIVALLILHIAYSLLGRTRGAKIKAVFTGMDELRPEEVKH